MYADQNCQEFYDFAKNVSNIDLKLPNEYDVCIQNILNKIPLDDNIFKDECFIPSY